MNRRRALRAGVVVWVAAGAALALSSLGNANEDARLLVAVASIVGPLLGVLAAVQLTRRADRSAGLLLVLSALSTPTYFAYVINVPVLVVGGALLLGRHRLRADSQLPSRRAAADVLTS